MVETPLCHWLLSPALHPLSPHLGLLSLSLQILAQSQSVLLSLCPHLKSTGSPIPSSPSGAGVAVCGWNSVASALRLLLVCFTESPWGQSREASHPLPSQMKTRVRHSVLSVSVSLCVSLTSSLLRIVCLAGQEVTAEQQVLMKHSGATQAILWFYFINWAFWVLYF